MFGISGFELLIIAAFALVILGPDKIPGAARTAGRFIRQFKRTQEEMEAMVRAEMYGERVGTKDKQVGAEQKERSISSPGGFVDDDDEEEEEEE